MTNGSDNTFDDSIGMDQRKLDGILEKHRLWLDPHEREGERADLSGKNLRNLSFEKADLQRAVLRYADLTGANLSHAQLNEATLRGAILKDANLEGAKPRQAQLYDADLYGASLQEVDLNDVEGLAECQLAGTDLSNTKLPPGIGNWGALEQIKDISVQARTLLWVTIGACVFGIVTMSMTNDAVILSHIGSTLLPVVQINVPIGVFSIAMPVVLLGLYLYLHFQLQYLWNGLASLPSFFPDGVSLDERAYPLFLRSLVRLYVPLLKPPAQWRLQAYASIAAVWCVVPFTMLLLLIRYLRLHELGPTLWHIVLLVLASWFGWVTYHLAVNTLGGKISARRCTARQSDRGSTQPSHTVGDALIVAGIVILLGLVPFILFHTEDFLSPFHSDPKASKCAYDTKGPSKATPAICDECFLWKWLKQQIYADFSFGEISHKPDNWLSLKDEDRRKFMGVRGTLLTGVNLQGADGHGAFLVDATLKCADLQGADFSDADLRKATLVCANLQSAALRNADLRGANLDHSCLRNADLKSANLSPLIVPQTSVSETSCPEPSIKPTSASCADFTCAILYRAELQEANFEGANLKRANLEKAKLQGAILKDADLSGARLMDADLSGAILQGADLSGADLSEAKGLTDEQIKEACSDEPIKPPPYVKTYPGPCPKRDKSDEGKQPCQPCR